MAVVEWTLDHVADPFAGQQQGLARLSMSLNISNGRPNVGRIKGMHGTTNPLHETGAEYRRRECPPCDAQFTRQDVPQIQPLPRPPAETMTA